MSDIVNEILSFPIGLSASQEKAVLSGARHVKVIAGAGAGKTETLTRRVLYLLLHKMTPPRSIVAFTFTEKAAQTMKSRIYQRVQQLGKEDLLKKLSEMYIGTIHGFYLRILQERYGYGDYGVLDENQEMAFILRYGYYLGLYRRGERIPYSTKCERFLKTNSVIYNELVDRNKLENEEPEYYKKLTKYESLLRKNKRLTFDYMGYLAVNEIMEEPGVIDFIEHLIVDEFQDINYSQFQLIELIGRKKSIFVVGDPRQSIYQWRGSDDRFFLKLSDYFPDLDEIQISENRRSGKDIVAYSNSVADKFENIKYEHMQTTVKSKGSVLEAVHENDEIEAKNLAATIQELNKNGVDFSEIGVLFRSVNTSAKGLIDEFKRRKIPYIVGGKIGLFKRDEAQALGRIISWISSEGFWVEDRYHMNDKITGDRLLSSGLKYWKNAVRFGGDLHNIESELDKWKLNVLHSPFSDYKDLLSELLVILGYRKLSPSTPLDAAIMANIGRFSSLLGDFEAANRFGGKPNNLNLNTEIKNLSWYMNTYATSAYEEQSPDDLTNVDAVSIMTIHQAKGMEWPIVFVPSVVKGRFPSSMSNRREELMVGNSIFTNGAESLLDKYVGGVEGERRLFYVAATRAKDHLVISRFTHLNGSKKSKSIFLEEPKIGEIDGGKIDISQDELRKNSQDDDVISYSAKEILDYRRCPYHYRLSSQWSYSQGISPFMGYGETLHFCLRTASELIKRKNIDPVKAIVSAFRDKFFLPFASEDMVNELKQTVENNLVEFVSSNREDMLKVDEVETRIEFPVENASVVGKVDVIIKDGLGIEVRDYKTSDKVITEEDSKLQVQLYALGLKYLGRDVKKGSVVTLDMKSPKRDVGITKNELDKAQETAEGVIKNIRQHNFEGKNSDFCPKCEYNKICRWS